MFYTYAMSKTTDWVIDDMNSVDNKLTIKEDSMTACGKCKHLLKMPGVWKEFNAGLFCRAMPKQGDFNCFTGEFGPNVFWRCSEVNSGCCARFEEEADG